MKKIFLCIVTYFLFLCSTFANVDISLSLQGENQINSGEIFYIQVDIKSQGGEQIKISQIQGIENFDVGRQSSSNQVQMINGNVSQIQTITLGLSGNTAGNYTIGPVIAEDANDSYSSNSIEIEILDFSVPRIQNNSQSTQLGNHNQDDIQESETDDQTSDMDDIHDVKKLTFGFKDFRYSHSLVFLIFVLFVIIFYAFLQKWLQKKQPEEKMKDGEKYIQEDISEKQKIYNELGELSQKAEQLEKNDFYFQLNRLFRRYFLSLGIDKSDTLTLSELRSQNIDSKILDIFATSYTYKFSNNKDTLAERKQIIMNFMIFLKK